jgi:hypothetical protein
MIFYSPQMTSEASTSFILEAGHKQLKIPTKAEAAAETKNDTKVTLTLIFMKLPMKLPTSSPNIKPIMPHP